jgi:hypothetical protein
MTKAKQVEPAKPQAPEKSELEVLAEREARRGSIIVTLASEAKMWREFATGCKPGRYITETYSRAYGFVPNESPMLNHTMDEITGESWKSFALSMAAIAERRLREVLGA